jgi:carboxypeptidase Q
MQVANLIKQLKLKPKRTIRVIAWMNEENGLAGGTGYAKDFAAQMTNHVAAIESDLGADHPAGISGHASPAAIEKLRPLSQLLQSQSAGLLRATQDAEGADVSPMDALGVPTFAPIQDARKYFDYHHTPADTLDKVDPRELANNAAVMVTFAFAVANMAETLPHNEAK